MSNLTALRRARRRAALMVAAALFLTGVALGVLWVNTYMIR